MNGFIKERYQLQKAAELSQRAADARKKGKKSSNYGGGYLELRDAKGTIFYIWPTPIREGKQGDPVDLHSESKTIRDIVNRLAKLKAQGILDNVKIINVLIFTRNPPCAKGNDTCNSRMLDTDVNSKTGWIPRIRNASGINKVVLTVWHMKDVNGPTNQGNLQQVESLNNSASMSHEHK